MLVGSLVGWFVALLLKNFGSRGIIFMNVCFVIDVAMLMLLRLVGPPVFCLCVG